MISSLLKKVVPSSVKPTLRRLRSWPADSLELLTGQRDSMTPPKSLIFVGPGDFKAIGEEFRRYMIDLGGLRPEHRVLDVGSGIGRMAIPLTDFLKIPGEYYGFDIVQEGVAWCQKKVTRRFPHFRFVHSDVYNKFYNPRGKVLARDYRFPFQDESFDFIFATSVFTHLLPPDLDHYLSEIGRLLRPGGRSLITYFLLNDESSEGIAGGRSSLKFRFEVDGALTNDMDSPEKAIAYPEGTIRRSYEKYGMTFAGPVHYGSWCGREKYLSYQDIVLGEKVGARG